jgi:hypothetical protein
MGECRRGSRYRQFRRASDSPLVVGDGQTTLSPGKPPPDHRRWRGSNGDRVRLWKIELQRLADQLCIPITVCHLPPGTSKWNKIEHRLFSFITLNWRGKPMRSFRTIIQLIAATTTTAGLTVRAELDLNKYPKGVNISDAQLATVRLVRHAFHGDWNYTISPP